MNIITNSKNKFSKYLVITEDYPYSKNEEDRANLLIVIWNNDYEQYSDGEMGTLEIQAMEPLFCIKKNIYGFSNENVRLPISLLPAVLDDPSKSLQWGQLKCSDCGSPKRNTSISKSLTPTPNKNVKVPTYDRLTEGYDPAKL